MAAVARKTVGEIYVSRNMVSQYSEKEGDRIEGRVVEWVNVRAVSFPYRAATADRCEGGSF